MTTSGRELWERQPGETSRDFARFCRYRDLGPERSIPEAVRSWLGEKPRTSQQRRFRTAADPDDYVRRSQWAWDQLSRKKGWVARAKAFDEAVEVEARGRAVEAYVDEEAEQMRLRLVAARTLRARGLAVWDRFGELVDEGKLKDMALEKTRALAMTPRSAEEGGGHTKVEREIPSLFSQLGLAMSAIVAGLKEERLELGEVTERTALEGTLSDVSTERLRRVRDRLRELVGDDDGVDNS